MNLPFKNDSISGNIYPCYSSVSTMNKHTVKAIFPDDSFTFCTHQKKYESPFMCEDTCFKWFTTQPLKQQKWRTIYTQLYVATVKGHARCNGFASDPVYNVMQEKKKNFQAAGLHQNPALRCLLFHTFFPEPLPFCGLGWLCCTRCASAQENGSPAPKTQPGSAASARTDAQSAAVHIADPQSLLLCVCACVCRPADETRGRLAGQQVTVWIRKCHVPSDQHSFLNPKQLSLEVRRRTSLHYLSFSKPSLLFPFISPLSPLHCWYCTT